MPDRESFWRDSYSALHMSGAEHLDYGNEQEQLFTLAASLLVAGSLLGKRCLDAGCGLGKLARILHSVGAAEVVAFDQVETTMRRLREEAPAIRWLEGSAADPEHCANLGQFDRVFAIELLQYVEPSAIFRNLWDRVAPRGRLIGVVPNGDNRFVQRICSQYDGLYAPLGVSDLNAALRTLPGVVTWGIGGFVWREERDTILYDLLPLTQEPQWPEPPKRLLFVATRQSEAP